MQATLEGYILKVEDVQMKDRDTGEDTTMKKLTLYDETTGETETAWLTKTKLKGFDPRQVSSIKGMKIKATFKTGTYDGVKKTTLDQIAEMK